MAVHRPHPITGPWPYVVDAARLRDVDPQPIPLTARIPTDESRIYADPDDAVLYDACDRCRQHALDPWAGLDRDNLRRLMAEALGRRTQPTANQQLAVDRLREDYFKAMRVIAVAVDATNTAASRN